jgi:hypothetical protein
LTGLKFICINTTGDSTSASTHDAAHKSACGERVNQALHAFRRSQILRGASRRHENSFLASLSQTFSRCTSYCTTSNLARPACRKSLRSGFSSVGNTRRSRIKQTLKDRTNDKSFAGCLKGSIRNSAKDRSSPARLASLNCLTKNIGNTHAIVIDEVSSSSAADSASPTKQRLLTNLKRLTSGVLSGDSFQFFFDCTLGEQTRKTGSSASKRISATATNSASGGTESGNSKRFNHLRT